MITFLFRNGKCARLAAQKRCQISAARHQSSEPIEQRLYVFVILRGSRVIMSSISVADDTRGRSPSFEDPDLGSAYRAQRSLYTALHEQNAARSRAPSHKSYTYTRHDEVANKKKTCPPFIVP